MIARTDPGQDSARNLDDDHVDEVDDKENDPASEVEARGRQLPATGAVVVDGHEEPAVHRDPADDRDDVDESLDDHLAEPPRVLKRPGEAVAGAVHGRECSAESDSPGGQISEFQPAVVLAVAAPRPGWQPCRRQPKRLPAVRRLSSA